MELSRDLIEPLSAFSEEKARFLVVGGFAFAQHAEPRDTKDIDLWIERTPDNVARVWRALVRFGAPLRTVTPDDFLDPRTMYQIGVAPHRANILTSVDGVNFETSWKRRVRVVLSGVTVYVLSKRDLLRSKRAAGRPQDLVDIRNLTKRRKTRTPRRRRR